MAGRREGLLVANVRSASGGEPHPVKTDGQIMWCDCWPWRRSTETPKTCRHIEEEVLPRVRALGGLEVVYDLLRRGIHVEDAEAAPARRPRQSATLPDRVELLLERVASQQRFFDDTWRIEWRVLRAAIERLPTGPAPVSALEVQVQSLDWLGGGRAILLRD